MRCPARLAEVGECEREDGHDGQHRAGRFDWSVGRAKPLIDLTPAQCTSAVFLRKQSRTVQCALTDRHAGNHHAEGWEWLTHVELTWARPDDSLPVDRDDWPQRAAG